ncbi:MAG: CotH kinase family protein [Muribaculaceae bacterium]|nr:CotH kinase family protein [Muribaculaceae bacterium]
MDNYRRHIARIAAWLRGMALVVAMLCGCVFSAGAQVIINGVRAFTDEGSNMLLYSLPESTFGDDFTGQVQVDTASHWHNITVAGQPLTSNPVTFSDVSGDKVYIVRAIEDGKQVVKRLMFTFLPIMSIDGEMGYEVADTHVTLMDPDGATDEGMRALVKWRGGYTNTEGRHKRNYSIKFIDENGDKQNRKLLGLRRDNHWKLDAGQVDLSRVRNRFATDLWLDMAREPYYYDLAPDALLGARGKMVEVFAGGRYMGIYSLMESIDRKQLQIRKYDEDTHLIHGMLWNAAEWSKVAEFKQYVPYNNNSPNYDTFVVEYPEFEEVHPTHHEDLYNAVKFVATSEVDDYNVHAHEYFDMPVLIDYAIFIQFLISVDNGVNNIYWAIYDREVDKRLTLAAWDLDWSLGTNRDSLDFRGGRAEPDHDFKFSSREFNMFKDPECIYHDVMIKRYWQLRKSWLSEQNLADRLNALVNPLVESGAVAREEARWTGDSDINGLPLDIVGEKDYIIDWIHKRLTHLDCTLMRHPCDVDSDGAVTAYDIILVQDYLLNGGTFNNRYDVDGDGCVTSADLTTLYEQILGFQ